MGAKLGLAWSRVTRNSCGLFSSVCALGERIDVNKERSVLPASQPRGVPRAKSPLSLERKGGDLSPGGGGGGLPGPPAGLGWLRSHNEIVEIVEGFCGDVCEQSGNLN